MNKPYGEVTETMKLMSICPKCKREGVMKFPALSRRDNETEICSDCGTAEALSDHILMCSIPKRKYKGEEYDK